MGHDSSRSVPVRGNYDFSGDNSENIFARAFDEEMLFSDFSSDLFEMSPSEAVRSYDLPGESLIVELCLNPTVFGAKPSVEEVWHSVLSPLMMGPPDSKPHMHQLLANFSLYLKEKAAASFERERSRRTVGLERVSEDRRAIIRAHNVPTESRFEASQGDMDGLKSAADFTGYLTLVVEQHFRRFFAPSINPMGFSTLLCNAVTVQKYWQVNRFLAAAIKWAFAAADLPALIDSFVGLIRLGFSNVLGMKRTPASILPGRFPDISMSNACFVPTEKSLLGSVALGKWSRTPCSSALVSTGRFLSILGHRATITSVSLSSSAPPGGADRIVTRELQVPPEERAGLSITGGNGYIIVVGKVFAKSVVYRANPFEPVDGEVTVDSDAGFFATLFTSPKFKPPFASDGYYMYSLDSVKRVSIFSIVEPPRVRYHRSVVFQPGKGPLLVPYDGVLVPKDWIHQAILVTNGIIFSFLLLRRTDQSTFSYFMRHFSLLDGTHICDVAFVLKWPIFSLALDPWNHCVWAISPNRDQSTVIKLSLGCAPPPWFTGTTISGLPSIPEVVQSLNEASNVEMAAKAIVNLLTLVGSHFLASSFRGIMTNPVYDMEIAFSFAPCTVQAVDSLVNGILYLSETLQARGVRALFWSNSKIQMTMIAMLEILQYNLENFDLRLGRDQRSLITLQSAEKILDAFDSLLSSPKCACAHRLVCYTIVRSFSLLFRSDRSRCAPMFAKIHDCMPFDFNFFMMQTLRNSPEFIYCFPPEICRQICEPILRRMSLFTEITDGSIEWISEFQRILMYEMYYAYTESPMPMDGYEGFLQRTFVAYASMMKTQIIDYLTRCKSYDEAMVSKSPLVRLFQQWLHLFRPFTKFGRVANSMTETLQSIFGTFSSKINTFGIAHAPIRDDKQGFTFFFFLFYQIYCVYLDSIATLLDGGHELSDAARYQWLVKSTIVSGMTNDQIDELAKAFLTNVPTSSRVRSLLKKGLSFRLYKGASVREINADEFLMQCISGRDLPSVMRLFNYLYEVVPNRLNRRLNADDKHFERVIFSALMKQLGFLMEVFDISLRIDNGEAPVITHYMRQAMEAVYKARMILNFSKQSTQQFEDRCQSDILLQGAGPESLRDDYPAYRDEVLKKCVFLLHIQPCLRFQSQDFESAFSDYLKRLQNFIVSETSLKEYFHLIISSEDAKKHISSGMDMMNWLLLSGAPEVCRVFAIERLAAHETFLTFLSALVDGSDTEVGNICLNTISTLLGLLRKMMGPSETLSCEMVFQLNLILMIRKMGSLHTFKMLSSIWKALLGLEKKVSAAKLASFKAYFVVTLHLLYEQEKNLLGNKKFRKLVKSLFQGKTLRAEDVYLARLCLNMKFPIQTSISDLIVLMQKSQPSSFHGLAMLMCDMMLLKEGPNEDFKWPLQQLSVIAGGGFPSATSAASPNVNIFFSTGSILVQVFRRFLLAKHHLVITLFQSILNFAHEIPDDGARNEWYHNSDFLYAVFAVLSHTLDVINVNSFAKEVESNRLFYLTQSDNFGGWQLPITSTSVFQAISKDAHLVPIPVIPFTYDLFPYPELLSSLFVSHLLKRQMFMSQEGLSFYVLSSLREYCSDPTFLSTFLLALPKSNLTHNAFGSSQNDFTYLLSSHLRQCDGGFLQPLPDMKSRFYCATPSSVVHRYRIDRDRLASYTGVNVFITSNLPTTYNSDLIVEAPLGTLFDVGLFMLSTHQNGGKALMLLAHDDEPVIVGLHRKQIKGIPSKIRVEWMPSTKQASLVNADNDQQLGKMFFPTVCAVFIINLYKEGQITYEVHVGGGTGKRKTVSSLAAARPSQVQPMDESTLEALEDKEWYRFSNSRFLHPLVEYPQSVVSRIPHSAQAITTSLESTDALVATSVTFNEMSHPGFQMPSGACMVVKAGADEVEERDHLPPLHFETYDILPGPLIDFYATGLISRFRHETRNELNLRALACPSILVAPIVSAVCPTQTSLVHLLTAILLILEPINPINLQSQSLPIDFWFNSFDPNSPYKQPQASLRVALNRLLGHLAESEQIVAFTQTWLKDLTAELQNGFSHSVNPCHPYAVILPFSDITSSTCVSHRKASSWVILQSGFAGTNAANAIVTPSDHSPDLALTDNILCVTGERFYVTVRSRFSSRSLVAIPFVNDRNDYLFGTVFDVLVSFKYFVLFVRANLALLPAELMSEIRTAIYGAYFDSIIARSPFFVSFGNEILQFLQQNLALVASDLTTAFIAQLSLLSIYTAEGFEYIHQFVEEQQNVLDEVYVFGGQDFVNEFFAPTEGNPHNPSNWKLFQSPFPDQVQLGDGMAKLVGNLKRVLLKRKDVQSCPFHLLLHRWGYYSRLYPAIELTVVSKRVCRLKFTYYVPRTFKFVFARRPMNVRFRVGFDSNFHNARYVTPASVVQTNGGNELYLRLDSDEEISFSDLVFYITSDNDVPLEDFVRTYRSRFVLDAKCFFMHWEPRFDQAISNCFSVKQYRQAILHLEFDPLRLFWSHVHYPLNLLCCRCYFLMIFNFYYAHYFEEIGKHASFQSLLPSIAMKLKISRLRHLVARSNGPEGDFIRINRKSAFEIRDGQSKRLTYTLISQLSQVYVSPTHFRVPGDKPWKVHLIGEQGFDIGGLARELVAEAVADLMAPTCGLVVPIPDARNEIGDNRSFMIPIPSPRHQNILRQYHFVGALIAISIRSGLPQDFNFPPFFWEYLMTRQLQIESIYGIDHDFHSLITGLNQAMKSSGNPAAAIERFNLRFVIQNSMGKEVFLTPKGMDQPVTLDNCEQFIALAIEFRLNEMRPYLDEISDGLWENFKTSPPKYIDWATLEYAACGERGISIESLKMVTTFIEVPEDQQQVFWSVVEHFSNEQRSLLLKFVTGRPRLPVYLTNETFLKVDFTFGEADRMPTASTCFGRLHLPRYTTLEKARKLILLAIEYTGTFELG